MPVTSVKSNLPPTSDNSFVPPMASDLEKSVLGAALTEKESLYTILEKLKEGDFFAPANRSVYAALRSIVDSGNDPDIKQIMNWLHEKGRLDVVGGQKYIDDLHLSVRSLTYVDEYCKIIIQKRKRRDCIQGFTKIAASARDESIDFNDLMSQANSIFFDLVNDQGGSKVVEAKDYIANAYQQIINVQGADGGITGITSGTDVDKLTAGWQNGEFIVIAARPSMGKAQPLDAKIKTIDGWKKMGELTLGDEIASVDGKKNHVIGLYPQGEKEIYKITFSDGRSTKATKDHLWEVHNRKWKNSKVVSTAKLIDYLNKPSYKNRIWIERASGDFGDGDLPIDPWLLGFFLGDGRSDNAVKITTDDAQSIHKVTEKIPAGHIVSYAGKYDYRITYPDKGDKNILLDDLRLLGLANSNSLEKFIPNSYLNASKDERTELLRGLIDSDGHCSKQGSIRYSTSSKKLSLDVQKLVWSLGGICSISERDPFYTYKGERRSGNKSYRCNIWFKNPQEYATIFHKKKRLKENNKNKRLTISSIEYVGREQAQCIKVSHPSELYITDDYIVTHNTAFVLNALKAAARKHGSAGLLSLEMSSDGLGKRLLISQAGIDGQRSRRGQLGEKEIDKLNQAAEELSDLGLAIDDTTFVDAARLRGKVRAMIHKHEIKILAIDYVQLLTSDKDVREQQVAEISRTCKALAKEYNIPVIGLSQLNRSCESRRGWNKRPRLSDLRESGAIEQDADLVCFLFRPEYYDLRQYPETNTDKWAGKGTQNICEFRIGKNRNGPTGLCRLGFEKDHARFFNLSPEPDYGLRKPLERAKKQQDKYNNFNEEAPF